jgi:hypothetical protein
MRAGSPSTTSAKPHFSLNKGPVWRTWRLPAWKGRDHSKGTMVTSSSAKDVGSLMPRCSGLQLPEWERDVRLGLRGEWCRPLGEAGMAGWRTMSAVAGSGGHKAMQPCAIHSAKIGMQPSASIASCLRPNVAISLLGGS